jgi:RHS repeat-associated protein
MYRLSILITLLCVMVVSSAHAADYLSETDEIVFSGYDNQVANISSGLLSPSRIYEFVKNNFTYSLYRGSRSKSENTISAKVGNDVDLATLMIAMLRSQGISARYVVGDIRVPANKVMNWLGVKNIDLAVSAMKVEGIPHVALSADGTYVNFEHVWVEALVPYQNYRGVTNSNSYWKSSDPLNWVSLDPSFKQLNYNPSAVNLITAVKFEYTSYYNALIKKDNDYADKNPLAIYEENILQYLRTTAGYSGKTIEDIAYTGEIVREENQILPVSLPYLINSSPRRYASVDEHDAAVASGTELRTWKMLLNITLYGIADFKVPVAELSTQRLSIRYDKVPSNASPWGKFGNYFYKYCDSKTVNLYLDETAIGTSSCWGTPLTSGMSFNMKLNFINYTERHQPWPPSNPNGWLDLTIGQSRTYENAKIGDKYVILFGGATNNWTQFENAAQTTLSNKTIENLLETAAMYYMAKENDDRKRINSLYQTFEFGHIYIGSVSALDDVEYVDGTPFSITPGGLLIDVTTGTMGPFAIDKAGEYNAEASKFTAHESSAREHEVWQKLLGYDAISTVRGFQMGLAQGAGLASYPDNSLVGEYGSTLIGQLQGDIAAAASEGNSLQYTLPTKRVVIPTGNLFTVYMGIYSGNKINNLVPDFPLFTRSYELMAISNDVFNANGGYVDSNQVLKLTGESNTYLSANSPAFSSSVFTDKNLISQINNDKVRTPSTIDPVSTVTGNNYHDETDVVIKGKGLNIAFTRTYNSAPVATGTDVQLGYGWTHSYNMRLKSNDYGICPDCPPGTGSGQRPENGDGITSSITYVDERGGEHNYLVNGSSITPPQGEFDSLTLNDAASGFSSGYHSITFRNGVKYFFQGASDIGTQPSRTARLAWIEDPYRNKLSMMYNGNNKLVGITDNIGGRSGLTLTYNSSNRLQQITDWTGRTWNYDYDYNGNLTFVTNPLNKKTKYDYDLFTNNHNLTKISSQNNFSYDLKTGFEYYKNGKTFKYWNYNADTEYLEYDLFRRSTKVTDPRGFAREYEYDPNGQLKKLTEPDNGIFLFENNADSLRSKKYDPLGYTTSYSYRSDRTFGTASDTGGEVTREQDHQSNTIDYDYGLFDQVTRVKDKRGNVLSYVYYQATDPNTGAVRGKLQNVSILSLSGKANVILRSFKYYSDGNLQETIEYIDPSNLARKRATTYFYDPTGLNLTKKTITGATGGGTITYEYGYDPLGRLTSETLWRRNSASDATLVPHVTIYTYDDIDRLIAVTDPTGTIRENVYDNRGHVIRLIEHHKLEDRLIFTRDYDLNDRLTRETDVYGDQTNYGYDEAGNLIQVTDANGHVTRYEYDAMNRRTAVIDANGYKSQVVYDLAGRVVQTVNPLGKAVKTDYDALGRPVAITDAMTYQTQFTYDPNGNLTNMIDANALAGLKPKNSYGATVYKEYDELNQVVREVDASNGETKYTYDLLGNITSITDAETHATWFDYDDLGRLATVRDPLYATTGKAITFTYDEAGNVLSRTGRSGAQTAGSQSVGNQDITYTFQYDLKNRLKQKTDSRVNMSLSYSYDKAGNIATKTNYDGSVTEYRYDDANRLVAERNPNYLEVSYQYDEAGRLLNRILSNGARTSYTWDDDNRLASLVNTSANVTTVNSVTYQRDRLGNTTRQTDMNGGTTSFVYDPLYRLTNADYPGTGNDQGFTYDKVGNRLTMTKAGTTLAYVCDIDNRLKEIHQGTKTGPLLNSFDYDDDGNLLNKRGSTGNILQNFSYDAKGRVKGITTGGISPPTQLAYDPFGYRIYKSDSRGNLSYLLEGELLEGVMSGYQWQAKYMLGAVIDEVVNGYQFDPSGNWTNYTFHHDLLQSVVGLSGHEGSVLQTIQYGPFGENMATTGNSNNNFLHFTGRELDPDSGLYYYRARYYDPTIGRFITADPKGFAAGVNFYAYAGNNPINANDPYGLETIISIFRDIYTSKSVTGTFVAYSDVTGKYLTGFTLETEKNKKGLPPIDPGSYDAYVRTQGHEDLNRIELLGTYPRTVVQLHNANTPDQLNGCFAVGDSRGKDRVNNSINTLENLLGLIAEDNSGQIRVNVFPPRDFDIPDHEYHFRDFDIPDTNLVSPGRASQNTSDTGQKGGYVIYPNKANMNLLRNVYSK